MANQEILDYIKEQLEEGVSKEDIKKALVQNGWTSEDVDEAFSTISPEPKIVPTTAFASSSATTPSLSAKDTTAWKIILASLIGVVFVVSGLYLLLQSSDNKVEKNNPTASEQEYKLSLDIITKKDTYTIGEKFSGGRYVIKYKGEPFDVIVLYKKSRNGFSDTISSVVAGEIKSGESNSVLREFMQAFAIDETGFKAEEDSFKEEGEYTFTMLIYKCSDLELIDGKCSSDLPVDFMSDFQPIGSKTKTIKVIELESEVKKEQVLGINKQIKREEKTVLECAKEDTSCNVYFADLFVENLKSCVPVKGTVAIGWEPLMGVVRGYETLGIKGDTCEVDFWFLEIPEFMSFLKSDDPSVTIDAEGILGFQKIIQWFLNKNISCKYSSSERNIKKVESFEDCEGDFLVEFEELRNSL